MSPAESGLLEHYREIDVWVLEAFTNDFVDFEGKEKSLLVSDEGRRTLIRDWPQVARPMGISD